MEWPKNKILDFVLAKCEAGEQPPDGKWKKKWLGLCPSHDDHSKSLAIGVDQQGWIVFNCYAGCNRNDILAALGLEVKQIGPEQTEKKSFQKKEIEKTYDYTDEKGELLYQAVRFRPKTFRQRRWVNGEWKWSLGDVRRVLYRLPEIINADPNAVIYLVEGEKDVENLRKIGCVATCNAMGAGKWSKGGANYIEPLKGRHVVILPDNDKPGRDHAKEVARALYGKAKSIRIVDLPDLPDKGDVSDWLGAGNTLEDLRNAVKITPAYKMDQKRAEIFLNRLDLYDATQRCIKALVDHNDPPQVFIRSGEMVRITINENGAPCIDQMDYRALRNRMSYIADFFQDTQVGKKQVYPPSDLMENVLHEPDYQSIPPLDAISEVPIVRKDGTIMTEEGYDPASRMLFFPGNLKYPQIPRQPTEADVKRSIELIDSIIGDFPFEDDASLANCVAALLTPLLRPSIKGDVPLGVIDAPRAGSGKSLLSKAIACVATGRPAALFSAPKDDEEWRKKITTYLSMGATVIVIDNVDYPLWAPSLAIVLTTDTWTDRQLGSNKNVTLPHKVTWLATGNNVQLRGDLPRRCYWIRMDARVEKPWEREAHNRFRHTDLIEWILQNRGELICALLTLVRHWHAIGKPKASTPVIGGFGEWSRIVGGILEAAGIHGFLGNMDELHEQSDQESPVWRLFFEKWWEIWQDTPVTVRQVVDCAESNDEFAEALPDAFSMKDRDPARKIGHAFRKKLGTQYGDFRLVRSEGDSHKKISRWKIERVEAEEIVFPSLLPGKSAGFAGNAGFFSPQCAESEHLRGAEKNPANPANPADRYEEGTI